MSIEKSNGTIGNRNCDLPTCSAVPQTTALPRAFTQVQVTTYSPVLKILLTFACHYLDNLRTRIRILALWIYFFFRLIQPS